MKKVHRNLMMFIEMYMCLIIFSNINVYVGWIQIKSLSRAWMGKIAGPCHDVSPSQGWSLDV